MEVPGLTPTLPPSMTDGPVLVPKTFRRDGRTNTPERSNHSVWIGLRADTASQAKRRQLVFRGQVSLARSQDFRPRPHAQDGNTLIRRRLFCLKVSWSYRDTGNEGTAPEGWRTDGDDAMPSQSLNPTGWR